MMDVIKWFVQLIKRDMSLFTFETETDFKIASKILDAKNKEGDEKVDLYGGD